MRLFSLPVLILMAVLSLFAFPRFAEARCRPGLLGRFFQRRQAMAPPAAFHGGYAACAGPATGLQNGHATQGWAPRAGFSVARPAFRAAPAAGCAGGSCAR